MFGAYQCAILPFLPPYPRHNCLLVGQRSAGICPTCPYLWAEGRISLASSAQADYLTREVYHIGSLSMRTLVHHASARIGSTRCQGIHRCARSLSPPPLLASSLSRPARALSLLLLQPLKQLKLLLWKLRLLLLTLRKHLLPTLRAKLRRCNLRLQAKMDGRGRETFRAFSFV